VKQGVNFLGYRVFPHGIGLSLRSRNRFAGKFRRYESRFASGDWDAAELARHVQALISFTLTAKAAGFRRRIINEYGCYPQGL
jgi:hypothetical protein